MRRGAFEVALDAGTLIAERLQLKVPPGAASGAVPSSSEGESIRARFAGGVASGPCRDPVFGVTWQPPIRRPAAPAAASAKLGFERAAARPAPGADRRERHQRLARLLSSRSSSKMRATGRRPFWLRLQAKDGDTALAGAGTRVDRAQGTATSHRRGVAVRRGTRRSGRPTAGCKCRGAPY